MSSNSALNRRRLSRAFSRLVSPCLIWIAFTIAHATVEIPFVTVGDLNNPNDTRQDFGAVDHIYQIGKYDVTNAQYTEFLNVVDPIGTNGLALYNANMGTDTRNGGISFNAGAASGAKYSVKTGFADKPVVYVNFFDGMRFANWLNNGQGNGGTEDGAYTLSLGWHAPRNSGATFCNPKRARVV